MSRAIKTLGWTLLVALVLGIAALVAVVSVMSPLDHATFELNGETLNLAQLHGGHWLLAIGAASAAVLALVIALLVVLVVVPVAVLMPLVVVALVLAGLLVAAAGIAAFALSPVILAVALVWLIWRLVRGSRRSVQRSDPGARIAG
jgi:hypothetical protein